MSRGDIPAGLGQPPSAETITSIKAGMRSKTDSPPQGGFSDSLPPASGGVRPANAASGRGEQDTIVFRRRDDILDSLGISPIAKPEFDELAAMIARNFGIKVGENKRTLVTGRVHPMLEKYGFQNHRQLLDTLRSDSTGELLSELANRISTNHTAFFREDAHFKLLRDRVLPELAARKRAAGNLDLRVWCSACATGEEAYSLLFTMLAFFGTEYAAWRAGVLATDISAEALEKAKRGLYDAERMHPVPTDTRLRCFDRMGADGYVVKPELRNEVTFRRFNLNTRVYPFRQPFDVIFCRNVMIYFSRSIRLALLERLRDCLAPGGFLFVGHSESLVGTHPGLEYVAPAVYVKVH